ncbi:MAG: hypothetical protein JMJ88_00140 [Synergistaceae bacterium]|nr:hypothetical protein [Synergistaceae bacterium]
MAKKLEPLTMQMDDTADTGTGDTGRNIEDLIEEYLDWIISRSAARKLRSSVFANLKGSHPRGNRS